MIRRLRRLAQIFREGDHYRIVIHAKAGIHIIREADSRLRGNDNFR